MPDEPNTAANPTDSNDGFNPFQPQPEPQAARQPEVPAVRQPEVQQSAADTPAPIPQPVAPTADPTVVSGAAQPIVVPQPPKKRKKALIVGAIIAGVVALLVTGGVLAYNFWYQNPNKVVSDALIHAITAKAASTKGTIELKTKDYTLKIDTSARNARDRTSSVAVKITYTADTVNLTIDGEAIAANNGDIYLKANDLAKLAASVEQQSDGQLSFAAFDDIIKKVDSKWVKITKSDLGDVNKEYEQAQQCVDDLSKKFENDASFRNTAVKEVKKRYDDNPFITIGKKLGSKTVNGQGSLGYTLVGDSNKARAFFTGFGSTELGKKLKDCNKDIDFDAFAKSFSGDNNGTDTQPEVWVSRFTHEFTEIRLESNNNGEKLSIVMNPTFNANETVVVPSDAVPFTDVKRDVETLVNDYSGYATEATDDRSANSSSDGTLFN